MSDEQEHPSLEIEGADGQTIKIPSGEYYPKISPSLGGPSKADSKKYYEYYAEVVRARQFIMWRTLITCKRHAGRTDVTGRPPRPAKDAGSYPAPTIIPEGGANRTEAQCAVKGGVR